MGTGREGGVSYLAVFLVWPTTLQPGKSSICSRGDFRIVGCRRGIHMIDSDSEHTES